MSLERSALLLIAALWMRRRWGVKEGSAEMVATAA